MGARRAARRRAESADRGGSCSRRSVAVAGSSISRSIPASVLSRARSAGLGHDELARDQAANRQTRSAVARARPRQAGRSDRRRPGGACASARCCSSRTARHVTAARRAAISALGAPDLTDARLALRRRRQVDPHQHPGRAPGRDAGVRRRAIRPRRSTTSRTMSSSLSGRAHDSMRAQLRQAGVLGNCAACHGADGKGNPALGAPNLTDSAWLYGGGIEDIAETIRRRPQRRDARLAQPAGRGECVARRCLGVRPIAPDAMSATCWHCGEPLPPNPPQARVGGIRHAVCCNGCRAVAEWIGELGLADYYRLRTEFGRPGARPRRVDARMRPPSCGPSSRATSCARSPTEQARRSC